MSKHLVAEHRALLTDSIDADLVLHLFREGGKGLLQYAGLWGSWLRPDGGPSAIRVVLATVVGNGKAPDTVPLGALPWIVLQLQTVQADRTLGGDENLWTNLLAVLRTELADSAATAPGCASSMTTGGFRITYDPKQNNEQVRQFRDEEVLQTYRMVRVDEGSEDDAGGPAPPVARPAVSLDRERVCYRVHNVIHGETVPAPVTVFIEKTMPRHRMLWQCIQREAGYVREGDVRSALGEAKTWIVLEEEEEGEEGEEEQPRSFE